MQTEFTQIWVRLPNPQIAVELTRTARCRITMKIWCWLSNIPLDRRRDTFQPCRLNQVPQDNCAIAGKGLNILVSEHPEHLSIDP